MERDDAEQEGIELPPIQAYRLIARDEAQRAIIAHLNLCPFAGGDIANRLRSLELRFATLLGLMIGAGTLGGATGAILTKLLTP